MTGPDLGAVKGVAGSGRVNVQEVRADTPACERHIHLNNAGSSLMPVPVVRAVQAHIDLEALRGGYAAAADREREIREAYQAVARLLGTRPEQIAFVESATIGYSQALSSIPFVSGDVIITTRNDYVSNQIQFLSLQSRFGVRVLRAPDLPEGGVDAAAVAELIRTHRPRVVCVTHVPTNSGLVQNAAAIGAACRAAGVWYLVDACQSVGQMRVLPGELQCDFLSATLRKYLRGPRGVGFLYVSDRVLEQGLEPLFIDLRGAEWTAADQYRPAATATRFETWEFAWSLVLGAGAAADYAMRIGLDHIEGRTRALAERLRSALGELPGVRVLDRGPELCGIVSVAVAGRDSRELADALRSRGIQASGQSRPFALLDYDAKGVTSSLRLSPHYYNTESEIDRAVATIQELL